jgi:parallel beta-helix repeat protein
MRRLATVASVSTLALAALGTGTAGADDTVCTRVAGPGDSAQSLVDSLGPGDVGCLRAGTYHEDVTVNHGGSGESTRVVIRSYPGERATISGRLYVPDRADYVTVEQLDLDGHDAPRCSSGSECRLPSPTVNGDHIVFQDNDVTNRHLGICFNLGAAGYGRAVDDVIQRNRIHDCGVLPANNHEHGIYLAYSDNVQILDNVIYDNADRGVQLYPDAQRTLVKGNVIDGNGVGVIFSGAGSTASNDNIVENNIITFSNIRHDVESWYPDVIGTGNKVRNNCIYGGKQGPLSGGYGFDIGTNLKVDPRYVDRAGKDFRLASGSPCSDVLGGGALPAQPGSDRDKPSTPDTGGKPPAGSGNPPPATKPPSPPAVQPGVTLTEAWLKHRRRVRRWRLNVIGTITGVAASHRAVIQVRSGGVWRRVAVMRLRRRFHARVQPHVPGIRGSSTLAVRVVLPGVAVSRPHFAHVGR